MSRHNSPSFSTGGLHRCKLCGRTAGQSVTDAAEEPNDWRNRLPLVRVHKIVGAPHVCRICSVEIVCAFAGAWAGMSKEGDRA